MSVGMSMNMGVNMAGMSMMPSPAAAERTVAVAVLPTCAPTTPLLYCGAVLPPQLATMPPPPAPPILQHQHQQQQRHQHYQHQHQHQQQHQQQQQQQRHLLSQSKHQYPPVAAPSGPSTAPTVAPPIITDSAYASHYASGLASALQSGAPSGPASPVKATAPRHHQPVSQHQQQQHHQQQHKRLQQHQPSDSCYASRSGSVRHSRAASPVGGGRTRLGSVGVGGSASCSAAVSAGQSRRASRAPSPSVERRSASAASRRASPYAVVLPRGQARLLDEVSAVQLCRRSLQEELESAVRWLGELDWTSAAAFEAASDEAAVMEEEFRGSYDREPPTAAEGDAAGVDAAEEAESRIVLADTLLSMVEAAWTDEQEAENELRIAGKPMLQAQQRSSKPKKEDAIYNVRYKTLPCLHWQKNRTCPAGDHCHFAHGPQELRQPQKHPKFKTQICQNYKRTGRCIFGSRCFFKHSDN